MDAELTVSSFNVNLDGEFVGSIYDYGMDSGGGRWLATILSGLAPLGENQKRLNTLGQAEQWMVEQVQRAKVVA